jgi:uncharacterized small protein (TIGR04563 family)
MPNYLSRFEIDWGWPRLSETERAVVRRFEARTQADPGAETLTTLREVLANASSELPGRDLRARAEVGGGEYAWAARDGRCTEGDPETFDAAGVFPDPLTPDDFRAAGVKQLAVALFWPEGMLQALTAQATRLDASLSFVVQKAWALAASAPSPGSGTGPTLPRDGARRKQTITLPLTLYTELVERAAREDSSMSFVVQRVLAQAWPTLVALPR